MKLLATVLIAPFLFLAALSQAVSFDGDTLKLGGDGGTEFHDTCAAGEAVVGLYYAAGKDLDEIATVCQAIQGATVMGGRREMLARGGAPLRGVNETIACPEPMVVQAIWLDESAVRVVHEFWLLCRNLVTGEKHETAWSRTNGGQGGGMGHADCGDDSYAIGTWGGYGSLIDAIGLTCATYHQAVVDNPPPAPQDNTPPPPPPPPKPDKPPLTVNNGDQNADNGGTGGGGATAATDTTIYDQPGGSDVAYLSAGDSVTIVSCNSANWCKVSKPKKGWVWGDDLNR